MQKFQVLHLLIFISLTTTIIEAQYYGSKPRCPTRCGDVYIYHPFGIGRNCSMNKWFKVDCNSSTPYLPALNNMQMFYGRGSSVIVNMSVIRADCENPVQDINLVRSTSHGKSPFLFSGLHNMLVVEGCGSGVIMDKNGTIVAGCSTTCTNDTVSDVNNCFGVGCCQTTIPHDLESFTFNLTGLERKELYGKENCGSAFLVDGDYSQAMSLQSIKEDHTFVPICLSWNRNSTGCSDRCGEVMIPDPFGIGEFCSHNKYFNVDCNSSTPYLSAFNNVQLLGVNLERETVTVNVSKISDCNNPVQTNYTDLFVSGSPFYLSSFDNIFVVEGCGNAAIMDENEFIVAGCSTTCDNGTVRDNTNNCFGIGCCQTTIPYALYPPFTFNLTGLQGKSGNVTCGSAFLVDRTSFIQGTFSGQFVPVTLSWWMGYDDDPSTECERCEKQGGYCYPDRSGTSCHFDGSSKKSLILGCSERCGEVMIPYPFGIGEFCSWNKWFNVNCNSSTPYLSAFNNVQVLGVNLESRTVTVNVSKISDCNNPVQTNYTDLLVSRSPFYLSYYHNIFVVEGCGSAAIMDEDGTIVAGCSTTCDNGTVRDETNNCFGRKGCCQTKIPYALYPPFTFNLTGLQGKSGNVTCGSAFLVNRTSFIQGTFSHQFATRTVQARVAIFMEAAKSVSISMGVLLLTVITYALCKIIKKTKVKRRKQRCFKRNGGLLLKQQEATHIGLADKTILFTSSELEKATDHFNENRILGRGGQGTVYKGMLTDGRIVAIKKSKVVDESQLEQFINEVVILSQVNHRNVVRLLGCCLETEVPLLVSEFISNGTLYDLLQDETGEFPISLSLRLQIATEVAGAVSYLHSATSIPIYHRDIKSTNILLDEKYRAKVSDFGTSRFVSVDQTHLTTLVKGTFGYLDPEYFQSSQFTEKSDVYSFGVVLLELLTKEKPISLTRFGENRSLATHFLIAMEEGRVMSILDAMVVKEGSRTVLLAVANLAMRCLNFNGRNRPTMKEVATELEGIRLSHVPSTIETNFGHVKHCEEVQLTYGESTSTSMTFDYNASQ